MIDRHADPMLAEFIADDQGASWQLEPVSNDDSTLFRKGLVTLRCKSALAGIYLLAGWL